MTGLCFFLTMIKYHYNLYEDIKRQLYDWRDRQWIKDQKVVYFYPNPLRALKILLNLPKTNYQTQEDIDCYWGTGGTWGGYEPPDKIYICPDKLSMPLEEIIRHEITHLKYEKDVQGMTHQEKEAYIEAKQEEQS